MPSKSEQLAYWFFRLNGFLTIPNFVVHLEAQMHEKGFRQGTDVDVLGVRFPFRAELRKDPKGPMKDYEEFNTNKTLLILAEVKKGSGNFNKSWCKEEIIESILDAVGLMKEMEMEELKVSETLTDKGKFENDNICIRLCLVGYQKKGEFSKFPEALRISWEDVANFIFERFYEYRLQKSPHQQWDETGKRLWDLAIICSDYGPEKGKSKFFELIKKEFIFPSSTD
jgi:hypothetical protein